MNLRTMVVGLIDDHVAKELLILMMLCIIGMRWILLQLLPTCWIIQRGTPAVRMHAFLEAIRRNVH